MSVVRSITVAACLFAAGCGGISVPARDINRPPAGAQTDHSRVNSENDAHTPQMSSVRVPRKVEPRVNQSVAAEQVSPVPALRRQAPSSFVGASAVYVGEGDTVYALSRRHRIPIQAIIRKNELKPPFVLQVGQRIVLPRGRQHRVEAGQTLYSVAQAYDTDVYAVARLNGIEPPYTIRAGQILVLPDGGQDLATSAPVATQPSPSVPSRSQSTAAAPSVPVVEPRVAPATRMVRAEPIGGGKLALIPPRKPPMPVSAPPPRSAKGFSWPLQGRVISNFGTKAGGLRNDGINIRASHGAPVSAADNGVVAYAGNEIRGFGNLLLIKHAGGYITAYAHNDRLLVNRGERVTRGQKIATVGATGSVTEPQLHFEVRRGRKPQDPKRYLPRAS